MEQQYDLSTMSNTLHELIIECGKLKKEVEEIRKRQINPFINSWYGTYGNWKKFFCFFLEHTPAYQDKEFHYDGSVTYHYKCSRCGEFGDGLG